MPAVADPDGSNVFNEDFGKDTSYDIVFLIAQSDIPDNTTDTGSEETASRVAYQGEEYRLETINTRFPAGFAIFGCISGDEV
jgi:hypothetical protein